MTRNEPLLCSAIIILVTLLKKTYNSATSSEAQAMRWVVHVDRDLIPTQLLSEIALLREFEFCRDCLVGVLNHLHPLARHVVRSMQLGRGGASKSQSGVA